MTTETGGLDLAAIRARADAATPGDWEATNNHRILGPPPALPSHSLPRDLNPVAEAGNYADALFIAAARTDVPALLAEVERLTAGAAALNLEVGRG